MDDANSAMVNAVFRSIEDTPGCVTMLEVVTKGRGIPLAMYSERRAVSKHNARKLETASEAAQFTRGLQELGVRRIFCR